MKKFICFISLVILLCICLSGCNYLDTLRTTRGHFTEDGGIRLCDGTEYLPLPENQYFSPGQIGDFVYIASDPDAPLLLIGDLGCSGYKLQNGRFLYIYSTEYGGGFYCRKDLYDSLLPRFASEFVPDICCYSYYDPSKGTSIEYTLTSSQMDALLTVLNTQEPVKPTGLVVLDYTYCDLVFYSYDRLFFQNAADICYADGRYYLQSPEYWVYEIPEELIPEFEAIMQSNMSQKIK